MSKITREKVKQRITLEAQETTITWDKSNPIAEIYTHDPKLKRKLRMFAIQFPDTFTIIDDDEEWGNITCKFPSNLVAIRKPRELSEKEQMRLKEQGFKLSQNKRPEEGV